PAYATQDRARFSSPDVLICGTILARRRQPMRPDIVRIIRARTMAAIFMLLALAGHLRIVRAQQAGGAGSKAKTETAATTEKNQVDLAVTVYNSNIALGRDMRRIHLPPGVFRRRFEPVPAPTNPATVHFRSLNDPS